MNTDKILQLADIIEQSEDYAQSKYFHGCGTPACIAGHACAMEGWGKSPLAPTTSWVVKQGEDPVPAPEEARDILGLTTRQADILFEGAPLGPDEPTAADAAATLRHLAKMGEVRWQRA